MITYKVTMYFDGNDEDAAALQKNLAKSVNDEFEINAVYGVEIVLDKPQVENSDTDQTTDTDDDEELWETYDQSMYDKLSHHLGHEIEMVAYAGNWNVSVECLDCCEVLFSADNHNRHKDTDGEPNDTMIL